MNALHTIQAIKAVFFDVDGVLSNSLPQHLAFCREKAEKFKLDIRVPGEEEFRFKVAGGAKANPMREFLRTVGFPAEHIDPVDADYRVNFSAQYTADKFAGVDQLLQQLNAAGVPLGLVTSNVRRNVEAVLGREMQCFRTDLVFFGDDKTKASKAEALAEGVARLRLQSEDCVFVGDVPTDATAAMQAKVRFLGVTYGWGILGNEAFKTVGSADEIFAGLATADRIASPSDATRDTLYSVEE